MKAIILCGMPAVGKTTVARILASKLGTIVIGGGDILKEIASEEGYNAVGDEWWDTEEGRKFMKERAGDPEFDREVDKRLISRAAKGDVVITSYTLPWLSKDGIKVWLSGSTKSRAERMAKRDSFTLKECERVIAERDRKNRDLYQKLYGIRFGNDLSPFSVVVGTDGVPAAKVASSILEQLPRPGRVAAKPSSRRARKRSAE